MSEITYDRTMSDAEHLMWRLENEPHFSSTFGTVTILDRKPDFELFKRRILRASARIPRLRQRVHSAPGIATPPTWVVDVDFDIDVHVRRLALPKPGSIRQLLDLATLICADPFDRSRPLWQFTVVEGLSGHRAAVIHKLHHTIADGESGVRLSLEYLDMERDAIEPPAATPEEFDAAVTDDRDDDTKAADAVRDVLAGTLRFPLGVLKQVKELLADPQQIPDASSAAAETLRGIVGQLSDTGIARSPLWTNRSTRRHLEHVLAPLDETKAAARRLDGTLNTAFLTIVSDAAGRYHEELGAPVDSLRASMAVSTRTEGSGANAFSLVRLLVPTGNMPIDERFRAISEATAAARDDRSGASLETLAALATTLPMPVLVRLARQQSQSMDFATSNVRAAPIPMYIAGARVLHNVPLGPVAGVAFNLTLLSYDGHLDMGLNTDAAAVAEPIVLKRCLEEAIANFTSLAR